MHHLETIDFFVCCAYLEHIIDDLGEEGAEFHEKLIELYLSRINISPNDSRNRCTYLYFVRYAWYAA